MNQNSAASLSGPKAVSKVEQVIFDIDNLTDELNSLAGQYERELHPVLTSAPPSADAAAAGANPHAETELLTKLLMQRQRLQLVLSRYRELASRVSI